jgi:hypothetical protein
MVVPTPTATPVDGGDEGLLQVGEALDELVHRRAVVHRRRFEEVRQVVAGGEVAAGARDQDHPHRRIGLGARQRVGQGAVHLGGQGVLLFRARQFDAEHAAGRVDADRLAHFLPFDMKASMAALRSAFTFCACGRSPIIFR